MTVSDKNKELAKKWLRDNNKCGSESSDGFLCNITSNHQGRNHKAQITGGAEDGKILKEWGW